MSTSNSTSAAGIVVIGRNEGQRLRVCLTSCASLKLPVVYVDSGSTDDSVSIATGLGAAVVQLDMSIPFTAARARNQGLATLRETHPALALVQFLDGDCELDSAWLEVGIRFLDAEHTVAGVAGRLRERFPERSIYNRLCDIEWGAVTGECKAFGGIALVRIRALAAVGGFDASLIAGEEPELCVRLRRAGWRIWRLDAPMALHDAAMTHWAQWWRRAKRTGYAFAEGAAMHGSTEEHHYVAEVRRAVVWGLLLPIVAAMLTIAWWPMAILFLLYPLQWLRVALRLRRHGQPVPWTQAAFFLQARFAEASGALRFWILRLRKRPSQIIEYK